MPYNKNQENKLAVTVRYLINNGCLDSFITQLERELENSSHNAEVVAKCKERINSLNDIRLNKENGLPEVWQVYPNVKTIFEADPEIDSVTGDNEISIIVQPKNQNLDNQSSDSFSLKATSTLGRLTFVWGVKRDNQEIQIIPGNLSSFKYLNTQKEKIILRQLQDVLSAFDGIPFQELEIKVGEKVPNRDLWIRVFKELQETRRTVFNKLKEKEKKVEESGNQKDPFIKHLAKEWIGRWTEEISSKQSKSVVSKVRNLFGKVFGLLPGKSKESSLVPLDNQQALNPNQTVPANSNGSDSGYRSNDDDSDSISISSNDNQEALSESTSVNDDVTLTNLSPVSQNDNQGERSSDSNRTIPKQLVSGPLDDCNDSAADSAYGSSGSDSESTSSNDNQETLNPDRIAHNGTNSIPQRNAEGPPAFVRSSSEEKFTDYPVFAEVKGEVKETRRVPFFRTFSCKRQEDNGNILLYAAPEKTFLNYKHP